MSITSITCWHFASVRLRDGTPLPKKGDVLLHAGPVIACKRGFHGSARAIDALSYAPGQYVARVELCGTVVAHGSPVDKYTANARKNLTDYVDAGPTLNAFAVWCARKVLERERAAGREPDPRSWRALEVMLAWLRGEALDTSWTAARAAEMAAAMDASWDAARAEQNVELERALGELLEAAK